VHIRKEKEEGGKMRLKTILVVLMALMFLTTNLFSAAFSKSVLTKETKLTHKGEGPQTIQPTAEDSTLNQKEPSKASDFSNAKAEENLARSRSPNIFPFDSFIKDMSTDKTNVLCDFAKGNGDSAELVIGIENSQPDSYSKISDLIIENGGKLVNTVSTEGQVIAVVADLPLDLVPSLVDDVQASNLARFMEPNMKYQTQLVPNDPYWTLQWGPQKIEVDYAWNTTIGNSSVLVAVIDTGIDYDHPDLAANYVPLGYDWVNDDSDPMDDYGHGTHCAGIVAAGLNNDEGIAGVAQVRIMAEKGLNQYGYGYEDDLANAIIHAVDYGADILSNSWGGYGESILIHDAVKYAYDNGVLVVAAAGNEVTSQKLYPAAYDEVIAVTATDRWDDPAWFTNFGEWVEVAAPGVDIYSTVWDNTYTYMDGTSMACPHVSGVAALIWSQFPNMTRDWVRAQLRYTTDDLGDPDFDDYYGYGRINARKAVEQAPPDHDLLIMDWELPLFIEPNGTAAINTTVLNFGISDESDIAIQLLVDGSIVDSLLISFLPSGKSITVNSSWNPMVEGIYNVTSYVVPVSDETVTKNNAISKMVCVRYMPRLLVVDTPVPEDTGALDKLGYNYTSVTPAQFATVDLYKYNVLFIGWVPGDTLVNALLARADEIANWVAAGNGIVALAEYHEVNRWAWLPLSVSGSSGFYGDTVLILNPVHPVMSGLTDAQLSHWGNSYHGYFISYDPAWEAVAEGVEAAQPITLAATYGAGRIAITNQDPDYHLYNGNEEGAAKLLMNMIEWAALYIQYEHELTVSLETPIFLEPGDASLLNATAYNWGLSNETGVELQLLINGTIVESETIPLLVNGTFYTIDYPWTPTTAATYNVTAYAPPVPDENVTANNIVSKMAYVRYVDVALISDHTELLPITGILDSMGIGYDIYNHNSMYLYTEVLSLLLDYSAVIFYTDYRRITSDEYSALESYLSSGGNLLVTGFDCLVGDYLLADLVRSSSYGDNVGERDLFVVDASHPIMNGPYGSFPTGYHISGLYSDNDAAEADTARNAVTIAELADGYDKIIATDMLLGKVVFWNGVGVDDWMWNADCEAMFKNMLVWFIIQYEHELTVSLDASPFLEPGDSSLLNATVHNRGLSNETNVGLQLLINGTEVESVTIPTLPNGTSNVLSHLWTPTVEALYNVTAYAIPVPGENITVNNVATKMVRVRPVSGYVLFDQTHYTDSISYYNIWVTDLFDRGYIVDTLATSPITQPMLEDYDVFVIPQADDYYSSSELLAIRNFVLNGGGLLVIGDDNPYIYTDLTSFAGMTWDWGGISGYTSDITPHPVTEGVTIAYFGAPMSQMSVSSPAIDLIRDGYGEIMLAVSEVGLGAVIGIADEDSIMDYSISYGDNQRLANNMVDWLKSRHPFASFTHLPLDPYVGETVTFDASASYDPDGIIVSYIWDFGDDSSGEGNITTHLYADGGTYTVTLTVIDNENMESTFTTEITVSRTTIEIETEVGSTHFRGEIAEFYILVSGLGKPVDANINATLYYNGNIHEDLSTSVENIDLGFYRIPYTIPIDASTGTYALLVEARYLSLSGVSLKSFLLSPTLTEWNAWLIDIQGDIATIKTDIGTIKVSLEDINPRLEDIEERLPFQKTIVATIDTEIGVIWVDLADINAVLTSIDGRIATVDTDIGLMQVDISKINAELITLSGTTATIKSDLGTITTDTANIRLKVTEISEDTATIETTFGTFTGEITSMEKDIATIETDFGTVKANIGTIEETSQTYAVPLSLVLLSWIIIATGAILLAIFLRRKRG
jgi:thermitase